MPLQGWKDVLVRTWSEAGDDNVGLVAAGVAFYGFLALVPLLGAIVLSYGLIADPQTVIRNMQALTSVMPADAAKLVGEQLMNVVQTSGGKKGFGLLLALALAVFGARGAAGSIITALNIAYEEKEKRGFIAVNLLALGITAAGVLVAILAVIAIAALGHLEDLLPTAPDALLIVGKLLSYVALVLTGAAGAATLYRYGPSREQPRWVWLTPGSVLAALLWMVLTIGFGIYVANFGNYNATYGSLGAVVVLLTWLYLSSYILLFGAELNAELEHQTAKDTTSGADAPVGKRGAWVADHVAGDGKPDRRNEPTLAGPNTMPVQAEPSAAVNYGAALAASRLSGVIDARRAGMFSTGVAVVGLGFFRRRTKLTYGIATLVVAAGLSWLSGRNDRA